MPCSTVSKTKRLRNARKKRTKAARILGHLEDGAYPLENLLYNPVGIGHVRLYTLMKRTPGLGEQGIKRCLFKAKVYPMTRLDQLSQEEVERVVHYLPPRARKH